MAPVTVGRTATHYRIRTGTALDVWERVRVPIPRVGQLLVLTFDDEGGIYHAEGALDDGGWWTFNVWASDDPYQRVAVEILIASLRSVDMTLPQGRQLAVHWESNHP